MDNPSPQKPDDEKQYKVVYEETNITLSRVLWEKPSTRIMIISIILLLIAYFVFAYFYFPTTYIEPEILFYIFTVMFCLISFICYLPMLLPGFKHFKFAYWHPKDEIKKGSKNNYFDILFFYCIPLFISGAIIGSLWLTMATITNIVAKKSFSSIVTITSVSCDRSGYNSNINNGLIVKFNFTDGFASEAKLNLPARFCDHYEEQLFKENNTAIFKGREWKLGRIINQIILNNNATIPASEYKIIIK